MRRCSRQLKWILAVFGLVALASAPALAQGGGTASSLSGLVVDTSGAVIPGADVVAKNNATNAESRAVTDSAGRFTVPSLPPGTYTVKVSLMGFKTWSAPDVQLISATPGSVRAVLEVGALEETVVVEGATEIVQTQSAAVQTTIAVKQIESLPLVTRTALDYVVALPGVTTTGTNSRGSTINGLPTGTINITIDGVNAQDNNNRTGDGFFMYIRPMLDSVEEITVSTSTPGAESAGQGASQIRMVTRSGSNRFTASAYNAWRNQAGTNDKDVTSRKQKRGWLWRLNTPYYFNKRDQPKTAAGDSFIDDVRLQTPGFRIGGPIVKDKAFYFFNWEWFRWPNQVNRTRYLLNTNAQKGLFMYPGATKAVDLLAVAAKYNQVSTLDPTMAKLLGDIRNSTNGVGGMQVQDQNVDLFTYSPGGMQKRHFPTLRLDYNITNNHRVTFSTRYNRFDSNPDILNSVEPVWPGFPNKAGQYSDRFMAQGSVRSTFGRNMVNEFRVGYAGAFNGGTQFYPELSDSQFNCTGVGCQGVGGKGWDLYMGAADFVSSVQLNRATAASGPSTRLTPNIVYEDQFTWLKDRHTIGFGGTFTVTKTDNWNDTIVPQIQFSTNANDPAYNYFTESNQADFPGINATWAGYARNLYAMLTGRVTTVSGTAYLNNGKYEYLGERWQRVQQNEIGLFVSDQWRVRPNLTLTGGVRWELQMPFRPRSTDYSRLTDWSMVYGASGPGNMFKPGTLSGKDPVFENYPQGADAYKMEWNNAAPSLGVAWRPRVGGFLSKILSSEPVFRGGYSLSYNRYATQDFIDIYANNPGQSRTATRSTTTGTPLIQVDGFPVLLRDSAKLYPSAFPGSPSYPFSPAVNENVAADSPDLNLSYTHQWSLGWQRELGKSMAMEVRYVGNMNVGDWTRWNLNNNSNWNILENGFYEEFRKAQKNLQANIAAGLPNTFAYTGAPGTSPLPIFLAHFAGIPLGDARNQNPASYTSSTFRSSSWYNQLSMYNPNITGMSGTGTSGLQNNNYAANAAAAGLPANFWQVNPAVKQGNAYLRMNGGNTKYHAMQIDLRRRMSKGLLLQGSYVGVLQRKTWNWRTLREDWAYVDTTSGPANAFKFNWVYELPFGHGKALGSGVPKWLNHVIGGWEWDGQARIQTGQRFNFGGYRLVGMSEKELQDMFKFYKVKDSGGKERIYMLPEEVILNSIIALNNQSATSPTGYSGTLPTGRYIAPASGPDCVQYLSAQCSGTSLDRIITGPWFQKYDFSFVKRFQIGGRARVEARMDLFNVFDNVNFDPRGVGGSTLLGWQLTSAARDLNASQDAGGRITQFGLRFTW
jgi:hypothetical protein